MLTNTSSSVFTGSDAVQLLPVISAEWNQNLFNSPYVTIAGKGVQESITASGSYSYTGTYSHPYFNTNSVALVGGSASPSYSITTSTTSPSYKVVFYAKLDAPTVVLLNANVQGSSSTQYGSASLEINGYDWTKVEVFVGGLNTTDNISSMNLTLAFNSFTNYTVSANAYWTTPEVYAISYFNYQYNSLWPTDSVCNFLRPGEAYVGTGNTNISFPSNFRKVISTDLTNGSTVYAPISSIFQTPQYIPVTKYVPFLKNMLATDISSYQYYLSDTISNPSITSKYFTNISTNKLVFKFNGLVNIPNVSVYLNNSSTPIYTGSTDSNGLLVLYYNGSSWSTTKWTTMPQFDNTGTLSEYTTVNQITLVQNSCVVNSSFGVKSNSLYNQDLNRMHLIEMSPRLEIDLTSYVQDVSITKQLDSKSTVVPLSTINTDDANITLSAIPALNNNTIVPIFSNQSNASSSILANMLRKSIKIYINWQLLGYSNNHTYSSLSNPIYIPTGVFYVDSWNETDIETVQIQAYDRIRYLQTLPCADYVANYKTVFDIISTMLDKVGYTDYDIDSLYAVTNDPNAPLDMAYFYTNSKDTTVADALTQIFLANQIGAYIDEYGVMKFLSLSNILNAATNQTTLSNALAISDSNIYQGGYAVNNSSKVGKISIRYQQPKIKQSLALQNATDPTAANSPSFIFTTSNAQVWMSGSSDAVGFNYLGNGYYNNGSLVSSTGLGKTDNYFTYNINDLLDIFHTFNLNNNGYAVIENEIVSVEYKEYNLTGNAASKTVSVKNDIELAAEIDRFVNFTGQASLITSDGTTNSTSVSTPGQIPGTNITVSPTGRVTNIKRGLFGTLPADHKIISALSDKNLSQAVATSTGSMSSGSSAVVASFTTSAANPTIQVINCSPPANLKVVLYPTSQTDNGYHTYSTKFNVYNDNLFAAGIFFNASSTSSMANAYCVEFVKSFAGNTTQTINNSDGTTTTQTVPIYQYLIILYQQGQSSPIAWADISGMAQGITDNFEKVWVNTVAANTAAGVLPKYQYSVDEVFHLKVVSYVSDGTDGEQVGNVVNVFLNNTEVLGWQIPDTSTPTAQGVHGWKQTAKNSLTGVRQLPLLPATVSTGSVFGVYMSTSPQTIPLTLIDGTTTSYITLPYNNGTAVTSTVLAGSFREIYATQAILKERSTNYWWQTSTFLNGLVQNQRIFNLYNSYCMQTHPSIIGINYYDVQYQTPAATNVDILPISYQQLYFPSNNPNARNYAQQLVVDEYALSYSVPVNTGFRAKFAIANNSNYMVWLDKTPDDLNQTSVQLILWTHEIIANSDPNVLEKVINPNNITEVAQIDTPWIQSQTAAQRMLDLIGNAVDGFSKDTTLKIFGNPLIQLGDVVKISYSLLGINQKPYFVQSIKHIFKEGLETELILNPVGKGVQY